MRTIILFALFLTTLNVFAQRELKYENRSRENDVFGGKENEACVTFSSGQTISPLFYMDNKEKKPAHVDTIGTNVNYHLVFDASRGRENRTVTVYVNGFSPLTFQWTLAPKKQLNYYIFDPDSTIVDCYNQLIDERRNEFIHKWHV